MLEVFGELCPSGQQTGLCQRCLADRRLVDDGGIGVAGSQSRGVTREIEVPVPLKLREPDKPVVGVHNKRTKNLRAVQLLLGHTKLESTVRYLGIEVDDALEISEQTEI